ncbi:MAG TPA: hypothetical protein GX738_06555 [Firmicutes bacterium]|nr:hypothetical protein [Bacillota bacterium]
MSSSYNELKGVLLKQYALYPQMQLTDAVKLIYQSEFAGGHMISDEQTSLRRLQEEWALVASQGATYPCPVFEDLSDGLCRLNLVPIVGSGILPSTVNRLFVLTANGHHGNMENFAHKLAAFRKWCAEGLFPWAMAEVDAYLSEYRSKGYPAVSHSGIYRSAYAPGYRVVSSKFRPYFELLVQIDSLTAKYPRVNVAIDGPCASGKTSLAQLLAQIYDCNVIAMDHFFLPPTLRTEGRLAEPGGNVDYDRFVAEVLAGLEKGEKFSYGIYDCTQGKIVEQRRMPSKQLNIIEGVYSMHPKFGDPYQLKVFMQVDPLAQSERILQRNGAKMHRRFLSEWIPLENKYFATYNVAQQADLILSP